MEEKLKTRTTETMGNIFRIWILGTLTLGTADLVWGVSPKDYPYLREQLERADLKSSKDILVSSLSGGSLVSCYSGIHLFVIKFLHT